MLLKRSELEAIASGAVSLVFRRWRKPTVKTGGTLKTAFGMLSIERVAKVERSQITKQAAVSAGYESSAELLKELDSREGDIYRVDVGSIGADPRIALRQNDALSPAELDQVRARLQRLDAASPDGHWTLQALQAIERQPRVAAAALAKRLGFEKDPLKTNIRKLKNLGLTVSHEVGYELSPRGKVVLARLSE